MAIKSTNSGVRPANSGVRFGKNYVLPPLILRKLLLCPPCRWTVRPRIVCNISKVAELINVRAKLWSQTTWIYSVFFSLSTTWYWLPWNGTHDTIQRWTKTLWIVKRGETESYFTSYIKNQFQMDLGSKCEKQKEKKI